MISKACRHAIRAVVYLGSEAVSGAPVKTADIALAIDAPAPFTAKLLQKLVLGGIVRSARGLGGGFYIPAEELGHISLLQVVYAIDGEDIFKHCGLGLRECSNREPCPLHGTFRSIRRELKDELRKRSLKELVQELRKGKTHLKSIQL